MKFGPLETNSIAVRLPAALLLIGLMATGLALSAVYGLQQAQHELSRSGTAVLQGLANATTLSRETLELVASASQVNSTSAPLRLANESKTIGAKIDALAAKLVKGQQDQAIEDSLLLPLRQLQKLSKQIALEAEKAQSEKHLILKELSKLNVLRSKESVTIASDEVMFTASNSDSLIQLGELRRGHLQSSSLQSLSPQRKQIYQSIFEARERYLFHAFAIRSALANMGDNSRALAVATETRSNIISQSMQGSFQETAGNLIWLRNFIIGALLVLIGLSAFTARYAITSVSSGIRDISSAMHRLARGEQAGRDPLYAGREAELKNLSEAFATFKVKAGETERLDGMVRATHQLSHEIGNLIGLITGSLGMLQKDAHFSAQQQRHFNRISRAAERGKILTSGMLSLAGTEDGETSVTDVPALLNSIRDVLDMAVSPSSHISLNSVRQPLYISVNPAELEQAMLNLCLNAAASMVGGGEISVGLKKFDGYISITVADTGTGMAKSVRSRAFEPYFTTRAKHGGHGLGLSMVYAFMRKSNGSVRIEDNVPNGTQVVLVFPEASI